MDTLDCVERQLTLTRIAVMGILNVTPDSFSDGGVFLSRDRALRHAVQMVEEGAGIIDIGGESTRPGAQPVSVQEELDRVMPVIEAVRDAVEAAISIDTSKPEVMRAAHAGGAGMINDVLALRVPGALQAAAELNVPVCLMHMQGEPRTMQKDPQYADVVSEVRDFLRARMQACVAAGMSPQKLVIDPGFGFGKNLDHNLQLLRNFKGFTTLGAPLLVGLSRKTMIGAALNLPVERRLYASVALALIAAQNGAQIVRVHDVRATCEAIRMYEIVMETRAAG